MSLLGNHCNSDFICNPQQLVGKLCRVYPYGDEYPTHIVRILAVAPVMRAGYCGPEPLLETDEGIDIMASMVEIIPEEISLHDIELGQEGGLFS